MEQGSSHVESSDMVLLSGKPQSYICISWLPLNIESNSSEIKRSKPVKLASFYICILPPQPITILELDSDEQIVIACLSSVELIHKLWLLTTYLHEK
jgi:hypothetical protein